MYQNPNRTRNLTNARVIEASERYNRAGSNAERRSLASFHYDAPNRVWEQGENGLWASRPWREGEKAEYIRDVLGYSV